MFPKPNFFCKDIVTKSETLWLYMAKGRPKNSDVTNIGKVGMLFNITGTATDDGGFLSIEQKGLFLTICKWS